MTEHRPRIFRSDAEIAHIGEGLLACTLPRAEWTHEAHLAATTYLLTRRPDIDIDEKLPGENLRSFFARHSDAKLRAWLAGEQVEPVERDQPSGHVPAAVAG